MRTSRLFVAVALTVSLAGCAFALRSPRIAELKQNPGRYQDHTVAINGVVTSSWSIPLVPFKLYKVDDGTGEITVVAREGRTPTRGAQVRVKGRVEQFGTFGGNAIGLHLQQRDLYIKRGS